jgi:hypothetical protein
VVIDARIHHHNATADKDHQKDPTSRDDRKAMADPMQGCAIGRALFDMKDADERQELWGAVCHMRRTYTRYCALMGLPSPHAKVAGILAPTEAMETSADHPAPDLRPLDERVRSATSAEMALHGWLGWTDKTSASFAWAAVIYLPDSPIRDLPAVIRALQCVVDGIKGNRMIWRGASRA